MLQFFFKEKHLVTTKIYICPLKCFLNVLRSKRIQKCPTCRRKVEDGEEEGGEEEVRADREKQKKNNKEEQRARRHVSSVSQPCVSSVPCRSCLWWSAAPRGSPWATWNTRPNTACRRRSSSSTRPRAAPAVQRNVSPRWGEAGTEAGCETPVQNITATVISGWVFLSVFIKRNCILFYKMTFADENLNIHPSIHPLGRGTPWTRRRTKYSPQSCKMQT